MWRLRLERGGKKREREEVPPSAADQKPDASKAGNEEDDIAITENFCLRAGLPQGVCVSAASLIGSRRNQQDSLYYCGYGEHGLLAAICDGMGGMGGGEVASQTACDGLFHLFEKEEPEDPTSFFVRVASRLDEAVSGLTDADGAPLGAGTTITAALVRGGALYWLSVGDSKLFLIRGRTVRCLTTPHNYEMLLRQRLRKGQISREEYEREQPRAEALVSYLGMGGLKYIDAAPEAFPLEPGDLVLLCSDGFYRQCTPSEMVEALAEAVQSGKAFEQTAKELADQVLQHQPRHMDNTSLILLRWQPQEPEEIVPKTNDHPEHQEKQESERKGDTLT